MRYTELVSGLQGFCAGVAAFKLSWNSLMMARPMWACGIIFNWTLNRKSDHPQIGQGLFGWDHFREWSDTLGVWTESVVVRCGLLGFFYRKRIHGVAPERTVR